MNIGRKTFWAGVFWGITLVLFFVSGALLAIYAVHNQLLAPVWLAHVLDHDSFFTLAIVLCFLCVCSAIWAAFTLYMSGAGSPLGTDSLRLGQIYYVCSIVPIGSGWLAVLSEDGTPSINTARLVRLYHYFNLYPGQRCRVTLPYWNLMPIENSSPIL